MTVRQSSELAEAYWKAFAVLKANQSAVIDVHLKPISDQGG
ncbi:hypothetical protein ACT3TA_17320 [Halomonas sp. AOP42-C1-46]